MNGSRQIGDELTRELVRSVQWLPRESSEVSEALRQLIAHNVAHLIK